MPRKAQKKTVEVEKEGSTVSEEAARPSRPIRSCTNRVINYNAENVEQTRKSKRPARIVNVEKLETTKEALAVKNAAKGCSKMLGAHVSASGGPHKAIENALQIGCRSFAFFVRNQRRWDSKPLSDEDIVMWKATLKVTDFPLHMTMVHGSYLLNCASPNPDDLEKSCLAMLDECQRCEALGVAFYVFHPGSTNGSDEEESLGRVSDTINYVLMNTIEIAILVETMAGAGNTIGHRFEQLRSIIDGVKLKKRVGVCMDTCHIFSAGYDLRTKKVYEETMELFDKHIGFKYLQAVHLNDSQADFGKCVDRHENIGKGTIGMNAFSFLMNDPRFDDIPMVLETPEGDYVREMLDLYNLVGNEATESDEAEDTPSQGTKQKSEEDVVETKRKGGKTSKQKKEAAPKVDQDIDEELAPKQLGSDEAVTDEQPEEVLAKKPKRGKTSSKKRGVTKKQSVEEEVNEDGIEEEPDEKDVPPKRVRKKKVVEEEIEEEEKNDENQPTTSKKVRNTRRI